MLHALSVLPLFEDRGSSLRCPLPVRFLSTSPESHERVPRLRLSPLMLLRSDVGFSQTRNSLKVSQPCGLKNDLLCSMPLRACSHLENRELSCSGKTSLVLCRWVTQASSTGLPKAFSCPATLDRPGRLGARSLHLSDLFWVARSTGLCTNSQMPSLARSTGLFETLSLSHELPAACLLFPPLLGIMFFTGSDLRLPCHPPPSQTHNRSDQRNRTP